MKWVSETIPSKTEFDDTILQILQRSEYRHLRNEARNFMESIKEIIRKWLEGMRRNTNFDSPSIASLADNLSTFFTIMGILMILAVIVMIVIKVSKTFESKSKIREILGEKIDDRTTPLNLRDKASVYRKEKIYRQAIRYDFIGILLLMHEKNLIYLDETKTNEEIYDYLRKKNFSMLPVFKELIDIFNSSWYGHKSCSEEVYDSWSSNIELLWNEVITCEEKTE